MKKTKTEKPNYYKTIFYVVAVVAFVGIVLAVINANLRGDLAGETINVKTGEVITSPTSQILFATGGANIVGVVRNNGGGMQFNLRDAGADWSQVYFSGNGNVGIGTEKPKEALHVKGNILVEDGNIINYNSRDNYVTKKRVLEIVDSWKKEGEKVEKDDYFALDDEIFRYNKMTRSSSDSKIMEFEIVSTGEVLEKTYVMEGMIAVAYINWAGKTYKVTCPTPNENNAPLYIDMDGDGDIELTGSKTDVDIMEDLERWKPVGVRMNKNDYTTLYDTGVIKYIGSTKSNNEAPIMKFKIQNTDEIYEIIYEMVDGVATGTLNLGGRSYKAESVTSPDSADFAIVLNYI